MSTAKQKILDAIQQTTKENGGNPLGRNKFQKETGIKERDWGKYWARWSDAQKEAGVTPNVMNAALDDEFVVQKMIGLIRKIKKFPTLGELRVEKNNDPEFPNSGSLFESKKKKNELAHKISEWCKKREGYQDIAEFCAFVTKENINENEGGSSDTSLSIGEVYLFKSGRYYKIGKTNDSVRRGSELRIQLPEKLDLIHSIKTDDPSGIEAYWHKRFASKRMKGEWFDLNSSEIKAFKSWRKIV